MNQADNIVTFPVDACTTDFLQEFIGSDKERLESLALRLIGIAEVLGLLKNMDGVLQQHGNILLLMETSVRDCMAVIDMRPVEQRI